MPISVRPATSDDFAGILAQPHIGVFYGAEAQVIEALVNSGDCDLVTYEPRERVFVQGESTKHLPIYIVRTGTFAVKHEYNSIERNLVVAIDTPGNVFGDVEWLIREVPDQMIPRGLEARSAKATITSMSVSDVLRISGDARNKLMDDPIIAKNVTRLLALKLLRRSARADAIQVYESYEVVGALFRHLVLDPQFGGVGVEPRTKGSDPNWPKGYSQLKCQITQEDWANALGVSTQTIRNIFAKLETEKEIMVYKREGVIYINDDFIKGDIKISDHLDFWW